MNAPARNIRRVVLDANVLVMIAVADLLLRLAKRAGLFFPVWSDTILEEVERTLVNKIGWTRDEVRIRLAAMNEVFPEARVSGYEPFIAHCTNHEKDRHVLACAIKANAATIVTFNTKDFRSEHLSEWGIRAESPQAWLLKLYERQPAVVWKQLDLTANKKGVRLRNLIEAYARDLPEFAEVLLAELE